MNFDQALFEYSLTAQGGIPKAPANFIINYEIGNKKCNATLYAPYYYKDKEGTEKGLKRAWGYACHGDEEMLYSITGISIDYEVEKDGRKETQDQKITA